MKTYIDVTGYPEGNIKLKTALTGAKEIRQITDGYRLIYRNKSEAIKSLAKAHKHIRYERLQADIKYSAGYKLTYDSSNAILKIEI